MSDKDLIIINNEKIFKEGNNFYCDNVDIKSIPETLNKDFNVTLIARSDTIRRDRNINLSEIKTSPNIFSFLLSIIRTFKKENSRYLIISITPYTFLSYLILFFFRKKTFVYLRSNGHEEYKAIIGILGPIIYNIMFSIVTLKSNIIKCQEKLFMKRESELVFPSELDSLWLENLKKPILDRPRLIYVGRIKVEKGIFSLLKILDEIKQNIILSIVGKIEDKKIESKNINYVGHGYDRDKLIDIYDEHNISILPSYTEAHPKVIDESLARKRPVIIFEDIKHVIQNKKGIFVCKRNSEELLKTINFIMKNYLTIQKEMDKNQLPTKKEFFDKLTNILS